GVRPSATHRGTALAPPPSGLALLRWSGDARQPGVAARQLPPADPRAEEELMEQAASCEGRWERLEPYEAEVSRTVLRGRGPTNPPPLRDRRKPTLHFCLPLNPTSGDNKGYPNRRSSTVERRVDNMMLTLMLAAGLLAAPEPQAEPQKGWVVEVRGFI